MTLAGGLGYIASSFTSGILRNEARTRVNRSFIIISQTIDDIPAVRSVQGDVDQGKINPPHRLSICQFNHFKGRLCFLGYLSVINGVHAHSPALPSIHVIPKGPKLWMLLLKRELHSQRIICRLKVISYRGGRRNWWPSLTQTVWQERDGGHTVSREAFRGLRRWRSRYTIMYRATRYRCCADSLSTIWAFSINEASQFRSVVGKNAGYPNNRVIFSLTVFRSTKWVGFKKLL